MYYVDMIREINITTSKTYWYMSAQRLWILYDVPVDKDAVKPMSSIASLREEGVALSG